MPAPSTTSVLEIMRAQGWVAKSSDSKPADGRPLPLFSPEITSLHSPTFVVGVDLGGTKAHSAGLLLMPGIEPILVESIENTDPRGGLDLIGQLNAIASDLGAQAHRLLRKATQAKGDTHPLGELIHQDRGSESYSDKPSIASFVLGCPGVLDEATGRISLAPNLPGWDTLDVPGALAALLGCPVQISNDVDVAALGEQFWMGPDDLAFISLGTGVGMGLILNGKVREGAGSKAGEICHLPLGADPYDRELQHHGVLESRLSGAGIMTDHRAHGGDASDVRQIFDLAAAGDRIAQNCLQSTADLLALTIRTVAAVVDPGVFVLGGGIGSRNELRVLTTSSLERTGGPSIKLISSAFSSRAGIAGALAAALTP